MGIALTINQRLASTRKTRILSFAWWFDLGEDIHSKRYVPNYYPPESAHKKSQNRPAFERRAPVSIPGMSWHLVGFKSLVSTNNYQNQTDIKSEESINYGVDIAMLTRMIENVKVCFFILWNEQIKNIWRSAAQSGRWIIEAKTWEWWQMRNGLKLDEWLTNCRSERDVEHTRLQKSSQKKPLKMEIAKKLCYGAGLQPVCGQDRFYGWPIFDAGHQLKLTQFNDYFKCRELNWIFDRFIWKAWFQR